MLLSCDDRVGAMKVICTFQSIIFAETNFLLSVLCLVRFIIRLWQMVVRIVHDMVSEKVQVSIGFSNPLKP